jgi:hypothetical protein
MGNTDAWLLESAAGSDSPLLRQLTAWTRERLSDARIDQVAGFPISTTVPLTPSIAIHAFHGSPRSFDEVISATTPASHLEEVLGSTPVAVHAGGHTHLQLLRRWSKGVFINPGSVGLPGVGPGDAELPVNFDVHWAEYAIVSAEAIGSSFTFHRLPVSVRQMIHAARKSGMPGLDWWSSKWR